MFVAVNKIAAPAERMQAMMEAFEREAPRMKHFKGYLGMELWKGENNTVLAVSRWESKEAMEEYTNHPMFKEHHGGGSTSSGQGDRSSLVSHYEAKVL